MQCGIPTCLEEKSDHFSRWSDGNIFSVNEGRCPTNIITVLSSVHDLQLNILTSYYISHSVLTEQKTISSTSRSCMSRWDFPCLPDRPRGPPSLLYNAQGVFSRRIAARAGTDHPFPSSAEVTNVWRYTSAYTLCLHIFVMEWPSPLDVWAKCVFYHKRLLCPF